MFKQAQRFLRQHRPLPPEDSIDSLLNRQNLRRGTAMTAVMAVLTIAAWVYVSLLFDKYFPWFSVLQGFLIGLAMQRYGQGIDRRFPLVAAILTAIAAVVGAFTVALFLTGREFSMPAWQLINEISLHTVGTFLQRDFGNIGVIYMLFACSLAAFYANRRLRRNEAIAVRRWREQGNKDET